jgi:hypothetical protein
MREYLVAAPSWVFFLVYGVPFGVDMSIFIAAEGESAGAAVVSGVVTGVLFGVAMTFTRTSSGAETSSRSATCRVAPGKPSIAPYGATRFPLILKSAQLLYGWPAINWRLCADGGARALSFSRSCWVCRF